MSLSWSVPNRPWSLLGPNRSVVGTDESLPEVHQVESGQASLLLVSAALTGGGEVGVEGFRWGWKVTEGRDVGFCSLDVLSV